MSRRLQHGAAVLDRLVNAFARDIAARRARRDRPVSARNLTLCMLASCLFYGGVTSPTVSWMSIIPLSGVVYLVSSAGLRMYVPAMSMASTSTPVPDEAA